MSSRFRSLGEGLEAAGCAGWAEVAVPGGGGDALATRGVESGDALQTSKGEDALATVRRGQAARSEGGLGVDGVCGGCGRGSGGGRPSGGVFASVEGGVDRQRGLRGRKVGIRVPKFWLQAGKFWRRSRKNLVVGGKSLAERLQIGGCRGAGFGVEWRFFGPATGGDGVWIVKIWLPGRRIWESGGEFLVVAAEK